MRLIIARGAADFPIEIEWSDKDGYHAKRVTEEMPPPVRAQATAIMNWVDSHVAQVLIPQSETYQEERRVREEIRKLKLRLQEVTGVPQP